MNESGDYLDEMMFNQSTDRDIERLFDGSLDPSGELAPVADLLESLRTVSSIPLDERILAGFVHSSSTASAAAARQRAVEGSEAAAVAGAAGMRRGSLLVSFRHRAAAIAVAAAVFVGGMTGMAVAADHAKPGDALYGIDRALEAVGIGNGRATERLAEAKALFDAGEVSHGLQHAAEAVETHGSAHSAATEALSEAAERVMAGGSAQSEATRIGVAGLLSHLSGNVHDLDGRDVAELAREIGRSDEHPNTPPSVTPPNSPGPPDHRPVDPPGRSDSKPGSPKPPNNRP